ncbi:MAG: 4'-phosphopantetheinyl transferase superfamily protein [Desulfovibrio sp.]|nr:4'-phosphopantetheinyl transferase superfamily protein [Desulfovibrio sp.]
MLEQSLPPMRARRMRSYRKPADRLHCLAGWLLLARVLGGGLDEFLLEYSPHGKPFLRNGPEFSLSHSGDFVLLAIGDASVGADIEQWRDENHASLARAAFHPDEFAALDAADMPRQFYELWVLKESYLKMRGLGLGLDPASFCLRGAREAVFPVGGTRLFFKRYRDMPGYSVAICSVQTGWPDRVTFIAL